MSAKIPLHVRAVSKLTHCTLASLKYRSRLSFWVRKHRNYSCTAARRVIKCQNVHKLSGRKRAQLLHLCMCTHTICYRTCSSLLFLATLRWDKYFNQGRERREMVLYYTEELFLIKSTLINPLGRDVRQEEVRVGAFIGKGSVELQRLCQGYHNNTASCFYIY